MKTSSYLQNAQNQYTHTLSHEFFISKVCQEISHEFFIFKLTATKASLISYEQ